MQSAGVVDSPEIREVLINDRRVKNALSLFQRVNKAYVGIGAISTNRVLKQENNEVSRDIQQESFIPMPLEILALTSLIVMEKRLNPASVTISLVDTRTAKTA